jgi:DNA-directed RNA polymerase subunit H (RpoH/RPB5)
MDNLFEKYKNIQKFIEKRNYKNEDASLDLAEFTKMIYANSYIKFNCIDTKKNKSVYIYLFTEDSIYISITLQFKKLISKLKEKTDFSVILITSTNLSIYINKSLYQFTNVTFFNYLHKCFNIDVTKGPFCSVHTILSHPEVVQLCSSELFINPLGLPAISINDVQCIWIGAELGQVIKITSISEITGNTIKYRLVTPDAGKFHVLKSIEPDEIKDEEKKDEKKDEIEDIIEDIIDDDDM